MSAVAPYLDTEPNPQPAAHAAAAPYLREVYRAMAGAHLAVAAAGMLLDGCDIDGTGRLEDDYSDLMALVGEMIEACGARVPA